MLIINSNDPIEPITGITGINCQCCNERKATWSAASQEDPKERKKMCAWCVLYGGSAWGHANRNEILASGIRIRQAALNSKNPKRHIPELDERHRLDPDDSEKLMLGVGYTSAHLRDKLVGPLAALRGEHG